MQLLDQLARLGETAGKLKNFEDKGVVNQRNGTLFKPNTLA